MKNLIRVILISMLATLVSACGGGGGGSADTNAAATATPTSISQQPVSVEALAGATAVFSVTATGDGLQYQWQGSQDQGTTWTSIPGAVSASYTVQAVIPELNGYLFRVVVTGAAGSVTSSAATLTATSAPTPAAITVQPAAQSVVAGGVATFSVTATGSALTYQWQSSPDATTWTNIDGATTATLTLNSATTANNDESIRVIVTNDSGSVTSMPTTLSVSAPTVAPAITTQPLASSVVVPQTATFTVAATGTPAPTFQWQASTDAGVTFTDVASATGSSYTAPATVAADNGKLFRVRVSNSAGSVSSNAALLNAAAIGTAPAIETQLASLDLLVGATATFTVTASGTPTPTYQWQIGSVYSATFSNINGATSASYTTPALGLGDGGNLYRAVATNSYGFANSSPALTTVHNVGSLGIAPNGIAIDPSGNLYIAGYFRSGVNSGSFSSIEEFGVTGLVSLVAGGTGGSGGTYVDGQGAFARFAAAYNLTIDSNGNFYVADGQLIRKVTSTGLVSTVSDSTGTAINFYEAQGVTVDAAGNIYVADTGDNTIKMVNSAGIVTTVAGKHNGLGLVNGAGTTAYFNDPIGIAVDSSGNIYVADYQNDAIRKIAQGGIVTTFAGPTSNPCLAVGCADNAGLVDGQGLTARFNRPSGVAVDAAGNVYVADSGNFAVRKIDPNGVVSTLAGGASGYVDAAGNAAKFSSLRGITIDPSGNVFVTDSSYVPNGLTYNAIRKISPSGVVTTVTN